MEFRHMVSFLALADELHFGRAAARMYDAILSAADHSGIQLTVADQVDDPGATAIIPSVKPVIGFCSAVRGKHASTGSRTATVQLYDPVPTLDLYAVWQQTAAASPLNAFVDCLPTLPAADSVLI